MKNLLKDKRVHQVAGGIAFVVVGLIARTRTVESMAVLGRSLEKLDEDLVDERSDRIVEHVRDQRVRKDS